jgi:chromosome segregation ATPase
LPHNPHLTCPQGEVEQISLMKPKAQSEHESGLLEYLEDIIGTDKYIAPIEEGAKRCVRGLQMGGWDGGRGLRL